MSGLWYMPLNSFQQSSIVGREGEDPENRFPDDALAFVAAEVLSDPYLPVERLGIVRRRGGPRAKLPQRRVASDDGPGVPDLAEQEVGPGRLGMRG